MPCLWRTVSCTCPNFWGFRSGGWFSLKTSWHLWRSGRPASLDTHAISPLQYLTLYAASSTPGHALNVGVQCKLAANLLIVMPLGWILFLLLFRLWGACLRMPSLLFGRLRRPSPNVLALSTFPLLVYWSAFSLPLCGGGNACLWLHQHPTLPPPVDDIIWLLVDHLLPLLLIVPTISISSYFFMIIYCLCLVMLTMFIVISFLFLCLLFAFLCLLHIVHAHLWASSNAP